MQLSQVNTSFDNPYLPPIDYQPIPGAKSWHELNYAQIRGFRPLALDVHVPSDAPGPVPCVIYLHGGSFNAGDRRHLPGNWPANGLFEKLIAAGLAVATVDYRLLDEAGPLAEVQDCAAAVRYLRHFADELRIDADRFNLWGESAGATLAALVGFAAGTEHEPLLGQLGVPDESATVRSIVLYYPPTDMAKMAAEVGDVLPLNDIDTAQIAAFSPVRYVHPAISPTLIVHGSSDTVVPVNQGQLLCDELRSADVDVELREIPDADHCFEPIDPNPILDATIEWVAKSLS